MLSASFYYGLGRVLGGPLVKRFLGERATRLVAGASFEGIILVRAVPLLPYTVVNLTAGAFRMRFAAYLVGTALGLLPLVLLVTLLGDRAIDAISHPTPETIALLVFVLVLVIGVSVGARRAMRKRAQRVS
jgi:phospholipase D1/2